MNNNLFKVAKENLRQQKILRDSINSIPKKNRVKFYSDLVELISLAKRDDYEDFSF